MRDEAQLIEAAAEGDRAAFAELVRLKRERVVRTARRIVGNAEDALDVAQAVFLKLWQGLGSFDRSRRFDTWMYRVTANTAIDLLRTRGAVPPAAPLPEEGSGHEPAAPARDADRALDLGRLAEAFRRLSADLAPQQRAVFVLRDIEGLPTDEVAAILGVAGSTVRNHLMQARRTLRAGLRRDYPDLVPDEGEP